jgi:Kef-type K+ transport system membrane component KefB
MGARGLGAGAITTVGAVAIFFVARLATAGVSSSDSALAGLALLDPLSVGIFMRERDGLAVVAAEVGRVSVAVSVVVTVAVTVAVAVAVWADAADEGNHSRTVRARPTLTGDR